MDGLALGRSAEAQEALRLNSEQWLEFTLSHAAGGGKKGEEMETFLHVSVLR